MKWMWISIVCMVGMLAGYFDCRVISELVSQRFAPPAPKCEDRQHWEWKASGYVATFDYMTGEWEEIATMDRVGFSQLRIYRLRARPIADPTWWIIR